MNTEQFIEKKRNKFKIFKQAVECQDFYSKCPVCDKEMDIPGNVIGWGEYPWGNENPGVTIRELQLQESLTMRKPWGVFFECPECFTISVGHPGGFGGKTQLLSIDVLCSKIQFNIDRGNIKDIWNGQEG